MNPNNNDQQYLRLLSIFHYIIAAIAALFACIPIIHFVVGIGLLIGGLTQTQQTEAIPMMLIGLFFAVIAGSLILFGWIFAACIVLAGISLHTRKRYMFCLVMAGVECIFSPFGTVLGIFTIILLVRPAVKELFIPIHK